MIEDTPPPNSIEIEKTLLGTFLCSKQSLIDSIPSLPVEAFYSTHHREIYSAMCQMVSMSRVVDMVTITDELIHRDTFDKVGGSEAIGELAEHIGAVANVPEYIRIVYQKYILRSAIESCAKIQNMCHSENGRVEDLICQVENLNTKIGLEAEKIQISNGREGQIVVVNDIRDRVYDYHKNGLTDTSIIINTEWPVFSANFRPAKKMLNIWTGIPSHGKSEFMDALMVHLALNHDWKWAVYTPENFPWELYIQKLSEKILGKRFFHASALEIESSVEFISSHWYLLEPDEDNITVEALLKMNLQAVTKYGCDGIVWDPWNEINVDLKNGERETDYIGRMLAKIRRHARRHNYMMNIVAHPAKMLKDLKTKKYLVPTLYDINGSANWYNKADNGFTIYRNFNPPSIEVHRQKIKFKIHGKIGLSQFTYELGSGRFIEQPEDSGFTDSIQTSAF